MTKKLKRFIYMGMRIVMSNVYCSMVVVPMVTRLLHGHEDSNV